MSSQSSVIVFDDFDSGLIVKAFTFTCDLRVGNPSDQGTPPADGFSISYARASDPVITTGTGFADFAKYGGETGGWLAEEGTRTGLSIGFDTWANGSSLPDVIGMSVRVDDEVVAQYSLPTLNGACDDPTSLQTGPMDPDDPGGTATLCWQPFKVELTASQQVHIFWKNGRVTPEAGLAAGFFPSAGRLVFGGRTGGANQNHHVDNISITTVPVVIAQLNPLVTTLAGSGTAGYRDATDPLQAQFRYPNSPAVNRDGVIFVPDFSNHAIRFITPGGAVGTWAGQTTPGFLDGPGSAALFHSPLAVALDAAGDLLVADADNHRIRRIVSAGVRTVTTVAGSGTPGLQNGASALAAFNFPNDLVVDSAGNVFLIEFSNHTVRRIARNGEVFTFAGNGTPGYADGRGTAARFNQPAGIALDAAGDLYVTEWSNHRVRKVRRDGTVTTVAGTNTAGFKDGQGSAALLNTPDGIVVDGEGNLYFTEFGNHAVRKITPGGYVLTLAGQGVAGYADGDKTQALFNRPTGIALHPDGSLIVAESENHRIRRIDLGAAPPPPPKGPLLSLDLTSALTIYGLPGETYRLEYADEGRPSNWIPLTNLTLTKPVEKWTDPRPATKARRFYRAVLQ
ncbi:MAG: SMP-30/gluconolactonase/LRE family protein [Verrucomicrobia bacterium]|nr:SMP-30/gluconolactonase/LRE family protein [Verrucomicrobiota bacterium]